MSSHGNRNRLWNGPPTVEAGPDNGSRSPDRIASQQLGGRSRCNRAASNAAQTLPASPQEADRALEIRPGSITALRVVSTAIRPLYRGAEKIMPIRRAEPPIGEQKKSGRVLASHVYFTAEKIALPFPSLSVSVQGTFTEVNPASSKSFFSRPIVKSRSKFHSPPAGSRSATNLS